MDRVIGHIDLDYFYAQVEEVEDPSIKARPVVVCVFSGRSEDSGVVSTSNYKARELGVRSGMPIVMAKKRLEGHNPAIFSMDHPKYEEISERIMEMVRKEVDLFEQTGIDEAFFDLTNSSMGDYSSSGRTAQEIKESILQNEKLTCSIGIGRSKAVAKLASDSAKPGGLMVVPPEKTGSYLNPLPVSKLYGVGPKTESVFESMGISTIGELARTNPSALEGKLGRKVAVYLVAAAGGTDPDPVTPNQGPTQFSRIVTLKRDTNDPVEAFKQLSEGIDRVHDRLLASRKSFRTMSAIGILTDLSIKTRSKTLDAPTDDLALIKEIFQSLLSELAGSVNREFRRVGIRVSELTDTKSQSSLSEFLQPAK